MAIETNASPKKMTRRSLAKGLAFGAVVAALPSPAQEHGLREDTDDAVFTGPNGQQWASVMPGIWRLRVGSPEAFTPVATRCIAPDAKNFHRLPTVAAPSLRASAAYVDKRGTTILLPLDAEENIYGFGLQMLSFNQRGKKKTLRVNADPRFDTGDSHAPVPFYVSSHGYGIFIDTARYATFCCGTARRLGEQTLDRPVGYAENAPKLQENERAHVTVQIDEARGVDVYLFAGPTMLDAVRRFNLFAGGGINPPEWGLGFWYRTQAKASAEEVLHFARQFRERSIPCDVLGIEPGWQTRAYSCSFLWGKGFPDPAGFVRQLGDMNYKLNLWEHAFVHSTAPFHDAIKPYSADHLVWNGLVPDFQSKEARSIFGEHHRKTFLDIGVSGFKLDECDNSDYTGGWSFPDFSHFPSSQDGEQMHSVFGLRYQQTILDQFEAKKTPTYGLVRSSGALAAPYPFVLYSDLYDHRVFVRSLVNSGFSGLLWCPEVRDAQGPMDLIRRLQTAVFSPLAMVNGWYIANPPWTQQDRRKNNANQLAPGWETLEAQCREVLQWRMMLIPYLRSAFALYALDGTPPFRALVLEDPSDPALATCDDQFMVGDRMMVAPLFDKEPSRKVVLPQGEWHDFWTGTPVAGGQTIEVPSTYKHIPVYIKTGSVLPVAGISTSTSDPAARRLVVRIFGDGTLPFTIASAQQSELRLSWHEGKGSVEAGGSARLYTVEAWLPATYAFR
jgi:alpha-D-xyloside xylohydrolase